MSKFKAGNYVRWKAEQLVKKGTVEKLVDRGAWISYTKTSGWTAMESRHEILTEEEVKKYLNNQL